jgi:hypothetical protein
MFRWKIAKFSFKFFCTPGERPKHVILARIKQKKEKFSKNDSLFTFSAFGVFRIIS